MNKLTKGAFYEAFEPSEHAAWFDASSSNTHPNTEVDWTCQCMSGQSFQDILILRRETAALSSNFNKTQRGVKWQMQINYARSKLKSVYPTIKLRQSTREVYTVLLYIGF